MNWDYQIEEPFWYYSNNPLEDFDEWEQERVESEDMREQERAFAVQMGDDYWSVWEDDPYEDFDWRTQGDPGALAAEGDEIYHG